MVTLGCTREERLAGVRLPCPSSIHISVLPSLLIFLQGWVYPTPMELQNLSNSWQARREREDGGRLLLFLKFSAKPCFPIEAADRPKTQKCGGLPFPSSSTPCKTMVSRICKTIGKMTFQRISEMKRDSIITPKKVESAIAPRKAALVLRRAARDRLS
jgi:hypothetical protein